MSRSQHDDLTSKEYERITCESGGVGYLWQMGQGWRYDWKLTDAILGDDGQSVYVKAEPPERIKDRVEWANGQWRIKERA